MGDIIDNAEELSALHLDVSLRNHAAKQEQPPAHFNGVDCVDCGLPITSGRRLLKLFRCVECQLHADRLKKLRAINGKTT